MRSGVAQKTRLAPGVGTILPRPPWGSLAIVSLMKFPELGIYTLPGHTEDPAELFDEVREAEALGLGSCWVSERFDVKDATVCASAMAARKA